jgi:ABC-type nitrate/sulfonate/bicarbonate transport system substrate-binding protein
MPGRAMLLAAGLATVLVFVVACSPATSASAPSATAGLASAAASTPGQLAAAGAPARIRFRYPVITPAWLPFIIAQDAGYYQKYGLDVEQDQLVPDQQMAAIVSNQIDVGGLPPEAVINAEVRGGSVVIVGALIQEAIGRVVTTPDIQQVSDLQGKTVAVSQLGSLEDNSFRRLFERNNLDPKSLNFVAVKDLPAELAAVKAGQAQAYLAIPPGELLGERAGLHTIFDVQDLHIPYAQASLFTSRAFLQANRDVMQRFLQATVEGLQRMKTDRDYTLATYIRYSKLDDQQIAASGVDWAIKTLGPVPVISDEALSNVLNVVQQTTPDAAKLDRAQIADVSIVSQLASSGFANQLK